jgi:hypothetical protein
VKPLTIAIDVPARFVTNDKLAADRLTPLDRPDRSSKPLAGADLADFRGWRVPFKNRALFVCSAGFEGLAAGGLHPLCCEQQRAQNAADFVRGS